MSQSLNTGFPAVLAGVCSISYLYFGLYIIPTALKDTRLKYLAYTCFFASIWSFSYVMFYLSTDAGSRDLWQRFTFAGQLAFTFHLLFWIRYTGLIRSRAFSAFLSFAIWIPPLIGAYKGISENAMVKGFPDGFWFLYAQIQTTVYNIASVTLLLVYHFKQKTNKSRMQAFILCSSGLILVTLSWIADYFFGYQSTPNIMPFWLLLWIGIMLFTIKKYRLISIMPDFISRDITDNIEEGIILLDPDFNVIFRNRAMLDILDTGTESTIRLKDIVSENHVLDHELAALARSESDSYRTQANLVQPVSGKRVPVDVNVKKVIDSHNDTSGFLMIVSRVKELDQLKTRYGITARELDVIRHMSVGKTNREIADFLNVTERTIETHVTSIYAKLRVSNRVRLMRALSGYEALHDTRN